MAAKERREHKEIQALRSLSSFAALMNGIVSALGHYVFLNLEFVGSKIDQKPVFDTA